MFEAMDFDTILRRMQDRISNDMDKREGSLIYDAHAPAALELELAYIFLDYALAQGFADTQDREFLIRSAAARGITPDPATPALLRGVFTPVDIDVTGRRFSLNKLNYRAVEAIEGEAGAYLMECETPGTAGNQSFGRLVPIEYIEGLETAQLSALLIPGEEEQDTESLRQEYFASFTDIDYGGNRAGYLRMALDQTGVGAAKVTPAWNGGGTVKITVLDAQYNAASEALIGSVQEVIDPYQDGYGDGLAFIDHIVTIDTATEQTVDVSFSLSLESGYSYASVQAEVEAAIGEYFTLLRKTWSQVDGVTVRIAQIESRLLNLDGILDISGTALNGTAANLTLDAFTVPVMGAVTNG